jgi:hypothetical protein
VKAERARLLRLQRLERLRAYAMQAAALESAQAESTLAQLDALASRTNRLAADYARRSGASDGAALQQVARFASGLLGISASTLLDADRARHTADARRTALHEAERRRAAAQDRAEAQARSLGKVEAQPSGARRALGTGLE